MVLKSTQGDIEMNAECNRCGKVVPEKSLLSILGKNLKVCYDCADEYTRCEQCGEYAVFKDTITLNSGKTICLWCLCENYVFCIHCHEFVRKEDIVEFHGHWLCKDCMESYFEPCQHCRQPTEFDELVYANKGNGYIRICPDCLKKAFASCSCCGSIVEKSSMISHHNKLYCQHCREMAID